MHSTGKQNLAWTKFNLLNHLIILVCIFTFLSSANAQASKAQESKNDLAAQIAQGGEITLEAGEYGCRS